MIYLFYKFVLKIISFCVFLMYDKEEGNDESEFIRFGYESKWIVLEVYCVIIIISLLLNVWEEEFFIWYNLSVDICID